MHDPTTNGTPSPADGRIDATYTVWILDVEPALADRYADWLDEDYRVLVEPTGDSRAAEPDADDEESDPDVAVLDREPTELSGDEFLARVRDGDLDCRVLVVTAEDVDGDVREHGVDSYLRKPVTRDDLRETVRRLVTISSYSETVGEYYAVASKKATLEVSHSDDALAACEEYHELRRRLRRLGEEADATVAVVAGTREFEAVFQELA